MNAYISLPSMLLNDYTYVLLMNLFDSTEEVDLKRTFDNIPDEFEYVIVTEKSKAKRG